MKEHISSRKAVFAAHQAFTDVTKSNKTGAAG
jgi:hypothetical protein